MDSEKLYRVQEEDLSKLEELLCRSFAADPLYVELIPDEEVRKRQPWRKVAGHEAAHVRRRCHPHRYPADPAAFWSVRLINKR